MVDLGPGALVKASRASRVMDGWKEGYQFLDPLVMMKPVLAEGLCYMEPVNPFSQSCLVSI